MSALIPEHSWQHTGITIGVMLATIMQALDTTIANVALPYMQGSLSATQDQIAWVLTSYIVAAAIMIPLIGWLSGFIGRKLIFVVAIASFTISSVLCGLAETLPQIIIFRILQGLSGAAFLPLSQAILFDINSPKNFGRAMAMWGVGVMVGPILGPALGGWLTENYNWRWVFYINVPVGIFAFLLLFFLLPESPTEKKRFDFFGFAMLSLAVACLQLFLDRGTLQDWFGSVEIMIEAGICITAFYLFLVHTLTHPKPFINPDLFKDRNFVVSSILIFVVGVIIFATLALLPPLSQALLNYPATTTGLIIAPRGVGAMISMMIVGRLIGIVDSKLLIGAGLLLTILSLYMMTKYSLLMDSSVIISSGVVQGLGLGLTYVPLTTYGFSTLAPHLRNEGTAFFNLMRNIGSSIGISIVEALLTRNTQILHASISQNLPVYNISSTIVYSANHIDPSTPMGLAALNGLVTQHAAMIAYINDFKFMMILSIIALPLLFLMNAPKDSVKKNDSIVME